MQYILILIVKYLNKIQLKYDVYQVTLNAVLSVLL